MIKGLCSEETKAQDYRFCVCRCAVDAEGIRVFRVPENMEESKAGGSLEGGGGGGGDQQLTEQQIIGTYKGMLSDVNQIRRKIAELEQEVSEHQ